MTRIFGFEKQTGIDSHAPIGAQRVFDNLQEALTKTYEKGWQAYGMGFIVVGESGAQGFSVFRGYQGLKQSDDIRAYLPEELHLALANNPRCLFGVLQNKPDEGEEEFASHQGWQFPLESHDWLVITMGRWWNDNLSDERLPWYNASRPSLSILQYLESSPQEVDFDWIDPKRVPYIVAVKKDGSQIFVVDKYSGQNENGFSFVRDEAEGMVFYQGVRNLSGEQI